MEVFLRSLSVCSNMSCVDDVSYSCMKILDWIYKTSLYSHQISHEDVQNIAKGLSYLNSCYLFFGDELPKRISEQYPYYANQVRMFFGKASTSYYESIAQLLKKFACTRDGLEHIFTLEFILNIPLKSKETPIPLEYSFSGPARETTSVLKMRTLAQRIFQLPKEQVDIAIDRMLNYIPFNVVSLVFCEPEKSSYSDSYCIIAYKIYEKLLDGSISPFFIRSLYVSSSISQDGKRFYWLCLKNEDFRNGMSAFFIRTLTLLSKDDRYLNIDIGEMFFEKHRLSHVFYLIWAALSYLSPCHSELHKQILDVGLSSSLLFLNEFDRIYD